MSTNASANEIPPAAVMLELLSSFTITEALIVVAELGVADELEKGPRSVAQIADSIGADPATLGRVLRCLESQGIFTTNREGMYEQTPLSETLRSNVPGTMRPFAIMYGQKWYRRPFEGLTESIRSGGVPFENTFGMPLFDYLSQDDQTAGSSIFNDAMTSISQANEPAVIDAYDFQPFKRIIDVGGGHGAMLSAILESALESNGVLYDLPGVVSGAREALSGVSDRCEIVAGSFFDGVPGEGDLYVLKLIIHDWSDERASVILNNIRTEIPPDGTLLLIDGIIPEGDRDKFRKLMDLHMMAVVGGVERTEVEYRQLLAEANFELTRVIPSETGRASLLEAKPV